MQLFKRYVSPRSVTVFAFEILLIFGSVALATRLHGTEGSAGILALKIGFVTAFCELCLYYNDFYDLTVVHSNRELVIRLLQAAGAASIVLAFVYLTLPDLALGRGVFATSLALFILAILVWRLVFNRLTQNRRLIERVLIVGTGPSAVAVARQILNQHDFGYHIVGFVDDDPALIGKSIVNPGVVGTTRDIARLVAAHEISRIVVGLADRRGRLPLDELLRAKLTGVRVEDATTTYERLTGKILIDDLRPSWLIFSDGFRVSRGTRVIKRGADIVLSLVACVVALPCMALTAAAVWLESGAPVLYRQERVGEGGRVFRLLKFRSMRHDAETGTPVWARDDDDRVTRVGRAIRTTRLDELPQLWNVLRGDMSFVGPRPERPFFVERLAREIPYYQERHSVRPGITGWAQVKYRYGASVEDAMEKLRYDLYYIKHLSPLFDVTIVFDTVKVILFGKGAK